MSGDDERKGAASKSRGRRAGAWIQTAIRHPGALHRDLGVPEDKTIPRTELREAAAKPGVVGQRARLALELERFHHRGAKAKKKT
jgi:hypothetical protein